LCDARAHSSLSRCAGMAAVEQGRSNSSVIDIRSSRVFSVASWVFQLLRAGGFSHQFHRASFAAPQGPARNTRQQFLRIERLGDEVVNSRLIRLEQAALVRVRGPA